MLFRYVFLLLLFYLWTVWLYDKTLTLIKQVIPTVLCLLHNTFTTSKKKLTGCYLDVDNNLNFDKQASQLLSFHFHFFWKQAVVEEQFLLF